VVILVNVQRQAVSRGGVAQHFAKRASRRAPS
jgi:hypothetical protein